MDAGIISIDHAEEPAFLVLHRLRITGFATEEALAAATAFHPQRVSASIRLLEDRGWVHRIGGHAEGFALTSEGHEAHRSLLASSAYPTRMDDEIYTRFSTLNTQFKAVCTEWQVRPDGRPNDHSDRSYDRAVLTRLWVIHDAVILLLRELAESVHHITRYVERLESAAHKFSSGDSSALLKPLSDSYHDVWMELHQDLRLAIAATAEPGTDVQSK